MAVTDEIARRIKAVPLPARVTRVLLAFYALYQDMNRKDLLKHASAMAYVTLLSLIPSLVAVFTVLSLFSPLLGEEGGILESVRYFIFSNLAPDSGDAVVAYLDNMLANLSLKTIGVTSFASVLVTLILLLRTIEEALNRIWLVNKARNPITRFMYFWTFLTFGAVVVGVLVGMSSGFDLAKIVGLTDDNGAVSVPDKGIAGSIFAWVSGFLFFFFLYKVVPNCRVLWKNAAIGAAIASFLLNQGSRLYGTFVVDAKSYKTLYGALAQLPIFLTWLYICWIIILLGALISWRLQEGFPKAESEERLDDAKTPIEALRNQQLQSGLPLITLIAIYRNFDAATGVGLSAQGLAHELHLPISWVVQAMESLQALGYVAATVPKDDGDAGEASTDQPYLPTRPATALPMDRVLSDLEKPLTDWMARWHGELPADLPATLDRIRSLDRTQLGKTTLAEEILL